jgi:hypothetical protein
VLTAISKRSSVKLEELEDGGNLKRRATAVVGEDEAGVVDAAPRSNLGGADDAGDNGSAPGLVPSRRGAWWPRDR